MADLQFYQASDESWATSAEVVVNDPVPGETLNLRLSVESQGPPRLLVFAAATPWGDWSPAVDARLDILDNQLRELTLDPDSPTGFASSDRRVAILIEPPGRSWFASITQGSVPFSVSALALHPTAAVSASLSAPPPRVRCRICKTTAKALALAIVAAAGAVFLPPALVAAVATFLGGVGTVAAMAFIQAVIGDTADVVAEKLCLAVGLCP